MSRGQEILQSRIESLRESIPELKGVLLAFDDGLPIVYSLSSGVDPNWLALMAAAGASLAKRVGETLRTGTVTEVCFGTAALQLFLYSAGSHAVLAVLGPEDPKAGFIPTEARSVANAIGDFLVTKDPSAILHSAASA